MQIKQDLTSQDILGELVKYGLTDSTCMAVMYYARNLGAFTDPRFVLVFDDEKSTYEMCIIKPGE